MKTELVEKGLHFDLLKGNEENVSVGNRPLTKKAVERVLNIRKLNNLYRAINDREDRFQFIDKLLKELNIQYRVSEGDLERIPRNGPLVVISNHPFGGLDGIILSRILLSIRPDVKVMANYILKGIPEISDLFIPVDPFGKKGSVRTNIGPLRETLEWLKKEGLVCLFPAGEVSHIHIRKGKITDPKWNPMIARIIRKMETPVIPVFFHGNNSALFQLFGLVHPMLRTVMLPREMLKKKGKKVITLKLGNPIFYDSLRHFPSDEDMINFFRMRTYFLKNREHMSLDQKILIPRVRISNRKKRVIQERPSHIMYREVSSLGDERTLVESNQLRVLLARAQEIPNLMNEIGRLRELTFRLAGEGTGKILDRDRFDDHYLHVFLWNDETREVLGAYRMGLTDDITGGKGVRGLYTRTLFYYGNLFLERIDPAIELGQSYSLLSSRK